jgi:hypothetical protein
MPTSSSNSIARLVHLDGLGDLIADGVDRRQRRHRILEDRADGVAAKPRHRVVTQPDQLGAVQPHRAVHVGVFRQQRHHRHRRRRLARSGFADDRDDLTRVDVKVDAAHRFKR